MATVVETSNLLEDAALIVDTCFTVEEGDVVTIICDDEHADQASAVAEVVRRARRLAGDHEQRDAGARAAARTCASRWRRPRTCTTRWSARTR